MRRRGSGQALKSRGFAFAVSMLLVRWHKFGIQCRRLSREVPALSVWHFTPAALPEYPAASLGDYCSGAYSEII